MSESTPNKAELLVARKCVLLMEETSHQELVDLNGDLPTDTHLVSGINAEGQPFFDAVRAYKSVDIFDVYYDLGYGVEAIKNGYGAIKPKLFVNSSLEVAK
tara:strand:+ start:3823 stop:4125 length:303 start_codon:yes stop_codon:yes gene_type:complete